MTGVVDISTVKQSYSTKRRRMFIAAVGDDETSRTSESCLWIMTASLDVVFISRRVYRPKTTEHNLIVRIGEIEAAVTIIRDCTRGIVRLSYTYRHEPWRMKHRAVSLRQLSFVFSLLEWRLPPGDATEQRSLRYVIIRHYRLQRARCTQSSCVECRRQGANCHQTTESCI